MAVNKTQYQRITDKNKLKIGTVIAVSLDGRNFSKHTVRKRLVFDRWEESISEYKDNYVQGWLIPMFKNGYLFKIINN